MNIKSKILDYLYAKNKSFFLEKTTQNELREIRESSLKSIYKENESFFENLLVENFVGFIPKDISEPTLKIFEEHAELLQRWILWQSHFINKRSLNDQSRLERYGGMMIYLKVLFLMAEANKKKAPTIRKPINNTPEPSFLEKAMQGVDEFKETYGKKDL